MPTTRFTKIDGVLGFIASASSPMLLKMDGDGIVGEIGHAGGDVRSLPVSTVCPLRSQGAGFRQRALASSSMAPIWSWGSVPTATGCR
jgi:hypothetical protein